MNIWKLDTPEEGRELLLQIDNKTSSYVTLGYYHFDDDIFDAMESSYSKEEVIKWCYVDDILKLN